MKIDKKTRGVAAAILAAILYGFEWIFVGELSKIGLNPFAITLGIVVFALVGTIILARIKKQELKPKGRGELKSLIWLGIFYSLNAILFFAALIKGLIASILLLNYLAPIWTILLARVYLSESFTRWKLLACLIAILGMFFVFDAFLLKDADWTSPLMLANFLALLGSFFYAGKNILSKKMSHLSECARSFWMFLVAVILLFLTNLLFPPEIQLKAIPLVLLYFLVLGVIIQMISVLLIQYAFNYLQSSHVSLLLLLEIVSGATTAWLFGGQIPTINVIFGGCLIIASCAIVIKKS